MTAEQLTENWDDSPVIEAEPRTQPPIHWRRPDGSLACGAEHNPPAWRDTICCRTHPVAATCTDCVEAAADEVSS